MLNINGKLLEELDESEYYLFSILLNYGTKSHPKNDVLERRTGWGESKLKRVKKSLKDKGFIKVKARYGGEKGRGRQSNQYVIKTKLASKYNGVKRDDFNTYEIKLDEINTVEINTDDFKPYEKEGGFKVLKVSIIESIKLLKEESKKALAQEIELLKIMNEKYKEEIEALNSELKLEVVPPPTDYSPRKPTRKKELPKGFESELDKSLKSYTFPKEIQAELLEKTLEYFSYLEQKKGSNWGIARTVNAQVKTIKDLTAKFTDEEIIKSLDECMDNGNVSFNPQWTKNREEREKKKNPFENEKQATFSFNQKVTNG